MTCSLRLTIQVPFVSDTLLPEQRGEADAVVDYRAHNLNRTNGHERAANYLCVRLSWNGVHIHQLCDPNDAAGRTTGVVRAAVENFFHDLKRAHFIDAQVLPPLPSGASAPPFGCLYPSPRAADARRESDDGPPLQPHRDGAAHDAALRDDGGGRRAAVVRHAGASTPPFGCLCASL